MKLLWNTINEWKIESYIKNRVYLFMWIFINIFAGAILWLCIGRLFLPGAEWLLCFMGYPAIFVGMFGGALYLYNHEFS